MGLYRINAKLDWLKQYIRPVLSTCTDNQIWNNVLRRKTLPARKKWACGYCKYNPLRREEDADVTHRFKKEKKRYHTKYVTCTDYDVGVIFRQSVIDEVRHKVTMHTYHVSATAESEEELYVHRDVFREVFQVDTRIINRSQKMRFTSSLDGRVKTSGRKPYRSLRERIENFWFKEVDKEPSHYDSVSTKQRCIDVSSTSHGYIIFLSRHCNEKYQECLSKHFFPRLTVRPPAGLAAGDIPVMACARCIADSKAKDLKICLCPRIPKFPFSQDVSSTFELTFKRPGSDQCEKYNILHDRMSVLRALGRHDDADEIEDKLDKHSEELSNHHYRAGAFRSVMADFQHTSKSGAGKTLPKYIYDSEVPYASKDLIQSIIMDAGSGLRTPFCRVGFTYFSRVLVTNV